MLKPRIIPSLLIHKGGLYKTVNFGNPKYVGDPINAVRIFNEKEVDELMVIDIDASRHSKDPNYAMIANLAKECRMPLCYGGGVKTVDQIKHIIGLGVEKVAISSGAIDQKSIISEASSKVGCQSVVGVIDIKRTGLLKKPEVVVLNGTVRTGLEPNTLAKQFQDSGAGEIVLNFVDRDGKMNGYDLGLTYTIRKFISTPITVLGGAGSTDHLQELISANGIIGAAAGSLFVFKGKYKAVLINYPNPEEKERLFRSIQ